jgi:hypothetical protein
LVERSDSTQLIKRRLNFTRCTASVEAASDADATAAAATTAAD